MLTSGTIGARGPDAAGIYVQIPAYRDRELASTLRSLYDKSTQPGRLRVRVMWQRGDDETLPEDVRALPRLELDEIAATESAGCNWARRRLQRAWDGERYTLLLDSHHRFVSGWDDLALGMLEQLRESGVAKPMLTGYLPAYRPGDRGRRHRRPQRTYPYQRDHGVLTRLRSLPIQNARELTSPIAADFASLHFILADGSFNADVPFDPAVYFFGDEVLTSVRAFAAGYRLFHPHRVIGWHAYDRSSRITHWADHDGYEERHRRSLRALRGTFRPGSRRASSPTALRAADVAAFEAHVNLSLVVE
jgi:hypothetical protein